MTTETTERWYAISAYNSQATYGYGTAAEADRYVDIRNEDRDINVYSARPLTAAEIADLDLDGNPDVGFNLDDELAIYDGIR